MELLLALPEHQVALPGGRRPSQTDLWLLARSKSGLVSIAVEGKVDESFGPTFSKWLNDASPGKRERLAAIQKILGLDGVLPGSTRYQLLHRSASAILEARRSVHPQRSSSSILSARTTHQWADYPAFLRLFGAAGGVDQAVSAGTPSGIHLYFAWVRSPFPATT